MDAIKQGLSAIASEAGLRAVPEGGEVPSVRCDLDLRQTARSVGGHCAHLDLIRYGNDLFFFDYEGEKQLMTPVRFRTWIAAFIVLYKKQKKVDGQTGEEELAPIPITLTRDDSNGILESDAFLSQIKKVTAINEVRLPIARAEGGVELLPEGYDKESQIWTKRSSLKYDEEQPLDVSKAWFERNFGTFPFSESRSKAVQVAAMISLYVKHLLPEDTLRPGFMYYANKPGSGKSAQAKAALYPVLGNAASAKMKKGEELDKELEAFSIAGVPYIFLDNVYGSVQSASLDQLLTSPESIGRAMGGHGVFIAKNRAQIYITGNNLDLNEDAQRRFLIVDLFEEGDPRERKVDPQYLMSDSKMRSEKWRAEALAFMWSLVKNWYATGSVHGEVILNTFEDFSRIIGGIVTAAGYHNPIVKAEMLDEINPEKEEFRKLLICIVAEMDRDGRNEDDITAQHLACIARREGLLEEKVGTYEDGKALTIKKDKISGEHMSHAVDLGYLDAKQASTFGKFLGSQMGSVFKVGDAQLKFGERKQRKKSKYSMRKL